MNPFGLVTALLLKPLALGPNRLEVLEGLTTIGFMQFSLLTLEFRSLLFQLLSALLSFELQLLPACCELLLLLSELGLHLLLQSCALLASGLEQGFALLPCLFPQVIHLPLRLLAD